MLLQLSLVLNSSEIPGEDYVLILDNKALVIQYFGLKQQYLTLICFWLSNPFLTLSLFDAPEDVNR